VHECGSKGANSESKTRCWNEPPRPDLLAKDITRNLENDVRNILQSIGQSPYEARQSKGTGTYEDAEYGVVVVVFQPQLFFEASQSCVACDSVSRPVKTRAIL
jgi:hypothetical protein